MNKTEIQSYNLYLTKDQTGLPFNVEVDNHFPNYRAIWGNSMVSPLTTSDLINIHLLIELRKKKKGELKRLQNLNKSGKALI